MTSPRTTSLSVHGTDIALERTRFGDYISLTDIACARDSSEPDSIIRAWSKQRETVEFLGLWETLHNPAFDTEAFEAIRAKAQLATFSLSPRRWILRTRAIGLTVLTGQNRPRPGIFAHPDIAVALASWLSVEFGLTLTREFQLLHLETDEAHALSWQLNRIFTKVSNRLHAQAIRANLIPAVLSPEQAAETYRAEADLLNIALFGMTASEWRAANPDLPGNMRDHATVEQLLVLINLQTVNAELIRLGLPQADRLLRLNDLAIRQMEALVDAGATPRTLGERSPASVLPPRVQLQLIPGGVAEQPAQPDPLAA